MRYQIHPLWRAGEYTYETGTAFIPTITHYLLDGMNTRPCVLVVPGGGYRYVSPTEAENVALKYLEQGMHACVLTYTTRPTPALPPPGMQPLRDIAKAVAFIRANAADWRVEPEQIALVGFSAGGHLAAGLSVHWQHPALADIAGAQGVGCRPNAAILSYPVITAEPAVRHGDSFATLLGEDADAVQLEEMSLEKQVGPHTPPTFLWHTQQDDAVPIENSLLYLCALQKNRVPMEAHLYPTAEHGTSTSDANWAQTPPDYARSVTWQLPRLLAERQLLAGGKPVGEAAITQYFDVEMPFTPRLLDGKYAHNASWVSLSVQWLRQLFALPA